MSNVKTIITFAVPAVTALLGLLWYFRRKPPSARRYVDPPDKEVPSKTEKSTTDKSSVLNNLSKSEVSNGLAGKGSSNTNENPPSSNSLETKDLAYHSNIKGDNKPVSTAASNVTTESTVSGCGDASNLEDLPIDNIIQETVIQTTSAKPCSSSKQFQVDDEVMVSETAKTPLELVEESIISPIKVENVHHGASETPSPKPDLTNTAEMSQKEINKNDTPSLSVDTTKNVSTNCIINDKRTENGLLEVEALNAKDNLNFNAEDQNVESASLSRSWHEDIPENMDDLNDDLSLDISPENGHIEQKTSLDNTNTKADISNSSYKVQDSNDQNSVLDLKQKNQSSKVPFDDQTSKTGLQIEKSENNQSDTSSNCDNLSEVGKNLINLSCCGAAQ